MALDLFLKIDGIPGESTDVRHPNEIELESFTWGLQQVGNYGTADAPLALPKKGPGAAKALLQDFAFVHRFDKSTPKLIDACNKGTVIPQALMTIRKAGGQQVDFMKVTLSDVVVASLTFGAGDADLVMKVGVALRYGTIKVEYMPQAANGAPGAPITAVCEAK